MNSRDRVLLALDHKKPDRIPRDLGGWVTTIHYQAYEKLLNYFELDTNHISVHDWIRQTVKPEEEVLEKLGIDFRHLFPSPSHLWQFQPTDKGQYLEVVDEWGIRYQKPKQNGLFFDAVKGPLQKDNITIEAIDEISWPDPHHPGYYEGLRDRAKSIADKKQFALVGDFAWETWYERSWKLRGFENFYLDMALDPDFTIALMKKVAQIHMHFLRHVLDECGEFLDIIIQGGDYGSQYGMLMSPEMYRNYIKPIQAEVNRIIREKTKARIFYHSCGSILPIIDDLIEIGVDILNPVQVSAGGMDPTILKKRFGNRLSFWGGIDTQRLLPFGNPEQIAQETKRVKSLLGADGGYVLSAVHNIQAEVPPENIVAMYQSIG